MNFQEKIHDRMRILSLFRANYQEGCVKITKGESRLHRQVKCDCCGWLKDNDWNFWTEATFKDGKRCDIVALHKSGMAFIFEIVCSESELSIAKKGEEYPLPIIPVIAKDFKYEDFCL